MMRKWRRTTAAVLALSMLFSTLNVPAASFNEDIIEDEFLNDFPEEERVWDMNLAEEDSTQVENPAHGMGFEDLDSVQEDLLISEDPNLPAEADPEMNESLSIEVDPQVQEDLPIEVDPQVQEDLLKEETCELQLEETQQETLLKAEAPDGEEEEEVVVPSGEEIISQVLTEDTVIDGDALINSDQTINLNSHKLTVKGNLLQQGGDLIIGGGTLEVTGDYRIQLVNDEGHYEACDGVLVMKNEEDRVIIGGNFYPCGRNYYDPNDGTYDILPLTAGTLEIQGNLCQPYADITGNLLAAGTHKVLLSGENGQTVTFAAFDARINILETKEGSTPLWEGSFNVNCLGSDITLNTVEKGIYINEDENDLVLGEHNLTICGKVQGGYGDIHIGSGNTLKVDGTLVQGNANLFVDGGTLDVTGDYRIQYGTLIMQNNADLVKVSGDFYALLLDNYLNGTERIFKLLSAGVMELKGEDNHFSYGFNAKGTHRVILCGESKQYVSFPTDTFEVGFADLEITKDKDNYIFNRLPCWDRLIRDGEELDWSYFTDFGLELFEAENGTEAVITDYLGQSADVEVPAMLMGCPVTWIGVMAFADKDQLESIVLPDTLKRIGEASFSGSDSLTEIRIPDGVTIIEGNAFGWCTALENVSLPGTLETIDDYAFYMCTALNELEIPEGVASLGESALGECSSLEKLKLPGSLRTISSWAFEYCGALTELEIPEGVTSIGHGVFNGCTSLDLVSLPMSLTEADWEGDYEQLKNIMFCVYPDSYAEKRVMELGLQYQYLSDEGLSVGVNVTDDTGNAVAEGFTVDWIDEETGLQLGSGLRLWNPVPGSSIRCVITLDEELARRYLQPEDLIFTAGETDETREVVLERYGQVHIRGTVKNEHDEIVPGAQIRIRQVYHSDIVSTDTVLSDENGSFSAIIDKTQTTMFVSAEGYYQAVYSLQAETDETSLAFVLRELPSNKITLSLSVLDAAEPGGMQTESRIDSFHDLSFSAYNETQDKQLSDLAAEYPALYLESSDTAPGDVIRLSVTDFAGQIAPDEIRVTLDDARCAEAAWTLIENGHIRLKNILGGAEHNVMVFDADHRLVENKAVNASYLSGALPAGTYSCVIMDRTSLFRQVNTLEKLAEYGLAQNTDYTMQEMTVEKGIISVGEDIAVPDFDESGLSFIDPDWTNVWTLTETVIAGQLADIRARYKIDEKYSSSNEAVRFDLPEGTALVPGSLTLDGKTVTCTSEDGQITVPVGAKKGLIRFLVFPSSEGRKTFYASLHFDQAEAHIVQPIGSCSFETAPVTIRVPSKSSSTKVSVSGQAEAGSEITLYDNERPVGYTVAQKNGRWNLTFDLVRPHQYSVHDIYAVASDPELHMDTRTNVSRLLYNNSVALFPVVTMINYCGVEYRTVFDFLHPAKKLPQYLYSASNPKFTFLVRFDRQTAQKMKEVYVVTTDSVGDKTYVSCTYDQISGDWIATHDYDTSFDVPRSVGVNFTTADGEYYETEMNTADLAEMAACGEKISTSAEVTLEEASAAGEAQVEEEKISYPLILDGEVVGEYRVEALDYADFRLSDWESGSYQLIEYADGTTCYQTSETGESSYITYSAYPEDELYIREELILASNGSVSRAAGAMSRFGGGFYGNLINIGTFMKKGVDILTGLNDIYNFYLDLQNVRTNAAVLANGMKELKKKKNACKCVDNSIYDAELAELEKEINEYQSSSEKLIYCAICFFGVTELVKGRVAKLLAKGGFKVTKKLYRWAQKKAGHSGKGRLKIWIKDGLTFISDTVGDVIIDGAEKLFDWLDFAEKTRTTIQNYFKSLNQRILNYKNLFALNKCSCVKEKGKCCCDDEEEEMLPVVPCIDPSGYVYEAVPSNRISGVKAQAYYYDYTYDENGVKSAEKSEILWNAGDYGQVNPLYTDDQGYFAWDVPDGQWLIRFSKEGYEDTDSRQDPAADQDGYLPVPPIQADVNTAIISKAAPEVKNVSAAPYEIRIEFDQYMRPETVKDGNVTVTCSGKAVAGTFAVLNAEADYTGENTYASIFVFQTAEQMKDSVTVAVRGVKNYVGTTMEKDYKQSHKVLLKPESITAEISGIVTYHGNSVLDIAVLPKEAGANRQLSVVSNMPSIIGVQTETVTTDDEGKASILISGNLPGQGGLCVTVLDTGLSVEKTVDVAMSAEPLVTFDEASFKVTVASEKYVYDGTEHKPAVSVEGLTEGTDYAVFYEDNIVAGTAKAIVQGLGRKVGTITKTFTIDKAANKLTVADITLKGSKSAQNVTIQAKAVGGSLSYKPDNSAVKADRNGKVAIPANFSGKIIVTVTAGDANYQTATKKVTITVSPTGTTLKSVKNSKGRKLVVKWAKNASCTGYQIQYSASRKFKSGLKTVKIKKNKTTSKTFKLKKGKTYYVRLRTYKAVSGGELYSDWSTVKKVKIKK